MPDRKKLNGKAAGFEEESPDVWKTKKFDDIHVQLCNTVSKQSTIEKWTKGCIHPFSQKIDLGIIKNYRDITLSLRATEVYNGLFSLVSYLRTFLGKIRTAFGETDPK